MLLAQLVVVVSWDIMPLRPHTRSEQHRRTPRTTVSSTFATAGVRTMNGLMVNYLEAAGVRPTSIQICHIFRGLRPSPVPAAQSTDDARRLPPVLRGALGAQRTHTSRRRERSSLIMRLFNDRSKQWSDYQASAAHLPKFCVAYVHLADHRLQSTSLPTRL